MCAALLGTLILGLLVLSLVDDYFDGMFKEWFYSTFLTPLYAEGQDYLVFQRWDSLKRLFTTLFFVVLLVLTAAAALAAVLSARRQSRRDVALISGAVTALMESDSPNLVLPKQYAEIEAKLTRLRAQTEKHEQLIEAETQRKNDLITYLAHDMKTPLASVIGYLSLLDEVPDMPAPQRAKYTGITLDKAYRLEQLLDEFFEITRFNLHDIVLSMSRVRLDVMLRQLADEFYPMLAPQHKRAQVRTPEGLTLWGDADKLARVFNNILKNAVAYSYPDTAIQIAAVPGEGQVTVTFENQGDPIPPQKLDSIFEKFYRLDAARSTQTGGAGLGLAIAKEIVEAHGGSIRVKSTMEHTVFTVTLPTAPVVPKLINS